MFISSRFRPLLPAATTVGFLDQAFILMSQHMRLDLYNGIHGYRDNDQRLSTKVEGNNHSAIKVLAGYRQMQDMLRRPPSNGSE